MIDLNALLIFARVAEEGSFSRAARRLKMPVSTVSRRVADLENGLGVRLLDRSTRRLRLTEVGSDILARARDTFRISEGVEAAVADRRTALTGVLRLAAPPSISDTLLAPITVAFQERHPGMRVEAMITERRIDPIADDVDLFFHVGPLGDSTMVARRLLRFRHQLVASPAYLARVEAPQRPRDLLRHRLLAFSHFRPEYRWTFEDAEGAQETVAFEPHLGINDFAGVTAGLLAGHGIGDLSPIVQPDLMRRGRLVEVMPGWRFPTFDLFLVHVASRLPSRGLQAFKELAAQVSASLFPELLA